MIQKDTFEWTAAKEQAARSVAEGVLTDAQIAAEAGVKRNQLACWKRSKVFAGRVKEVVAELAEVSRVRSIGRREDRVEALQRRWMLLQQVMDERAADPVMQDIPGGKTGLIVIKESEGLEVEDPDSPTGAKKAVAVPTEVAVDTGLLKELREHEKQAAQELGQWTEKKQVTGAGGGPQVVTLIGMTLEEFDKLDPARKVAMLRSGGA